MKLQKVTDRSETATRRWYDDACGTALGMELVGERWSLLVVRELLLGPRRFGELRQGLSGISANVLTQRVEGLAEAGIVERLRLPPPANVKVYALTPWGRECEPIVLSLGRWALRSPHHDATLSFTPSALMLSLKMLIVPERIGDLSATVGFRLEGEDYFAHVRDGTIAVARGSAIAQASFEGAPGAFLPVFYGAAPMGQAAFTVTGDRAVAERFAGLFALPPKAGAA